MKKTHIVTLLISCSLAIVLAAGCADKEETAAEAVIDISPQESFVLIEENQGNPDFFIIDVRTPGEFAEGHIEDAINVYWSSESFESQIDKFDRDDIYLVYCRSANRSRGAVNFMAELGFQKIYHLLGGIIQWEQEIYSQYRTQ